MHSRDVEAILARTGEALGGGGPVDLGSVEFWRAVEAVKRRPEWIARYAEQIASLDRQAFERTVRPTFAPVVGNVVLTAGTLAGLGLVAAAYQLTSPWDGVFLLAGTGAVLVTTHGLAHLVVGRAMGIRFTRWYLDGPTRLQPSLKVDYGSYLRTPPRRRAWMHASGALVSKAIPFLFLGAAWAARVPGWAIAVLLALGFGQLVTDLLFSVKYSDWKRFIREMRLARQLEAQE